MKEQELGEEAGEGCPWQREQHAQGQNAAAWAESEPWQSGINKASGVRSEGGDAGGGVM